MARLHKKLSPKYNKNENCIKKILHNFLGKNNEAGGNLMDKVTRIG